MERTRVYSQGSIREYIGDGDDLDRLYLPARSLCFAVQLPQALFILPDHPNVVSYQQQLDAICHGLGKPWGLGQRTIFIPDSRYLLDEAILANRGLVEARLPREQQYEVWPYASSPELTRWVAELKLRGWDIEDAMPRAGYYEDEFNFGHRGGWGRRVSWGRNTFKSFPERALVPYPSSFVGRGLTGAVEAYQALEAGGSSQAFFKPVFSAGGFTLARVSSVAEVRDHYKKLEDQQAFYSPDGTSPLIEMQAEIEGIKALYSFQYEGGRIVTPGGICRQIVEGNKWQGNIFGPEINPNLAKQSRMIFAAMRQALEPQDFKKVLAEGGVDLAVVEENGSERLIVIECNGQRITGGHPAIALAKGFDISGPFMTFKAPGEPNCDLQTAWGLWQKQGLSFNPLTGRGIFPIVWIEGSGMLWAAGEDEVRMRSFLDQAYNEMSKNGYLK